MTIMNHFKKAVKDVGSDIVDIACSAYEHVEKIPTGAKVGLVAMAFATFVSVADVKEANALPITPVEIGDNFLETGDWKSTGFEGTISYDGTSTDPGYSGNEVEL